mmetsp:Transcript_54997/g.146827  ORF Transcript_54997/g.146827 Transcript_54997/m.146827 type:complete len:215 (+) Transcript_54997:297-941(+)
MMVIAHVSSRVIWAMYKMIREVLGSVPSLAKELLGPGVVSDPFPDHHHLRARLHPHVVHTLSNVSRILILLYLISQPYLLIISETGNHVIGTSFATHICRKFDDKRVPVLHIIGGCVVDGHLIPAHILTLQRAIEEPIGLLPLTRPVLPVQRVLQVDHVPRVVHPTDACISLQGVGHEGCRRKEIHPVIPVLIEGVVALAVIIFDETLALAVRH